MSLSADDIIWKMRLAALIDEARKTGKYLYAHNLHGTFWFSPDDLAAENAQGRYVWSAENWSLRDPSECLRDAMRAVQVHKTKLDEALTLYYGLVRKITPGVTVPPSLDHIMSMKI